MTFGPEISRRDFIKLSAGSAASLGLLLFGFPDFDKVFAAAVSEVPVIWLQGAACTGCSVTVLNSLSPKIQDVLINQVIPGSHVSLRYHSTVMAASGDLAIQALQNTASTNKGAYVLIVEGAIPTNEQGVYCEIGESNGQGITMLNHVTTLGPEAMAVIALGTCAVSGGVPASTPNTTGCKTVQGVFSDNGIKTPVINLPGCPPHPDWFVGTLASILIGGLGSVELDSLGRPVAFYGKVIHDQCPRRAYFDAGNFATKLSEPYCLFKLGCKGPVTHADCPIRLWNSGTNWCVGSNSPCIGCAEPGFPWDLSPITKVAQLYDVNPPVWLPPIQAEAKGVSTGLAAGLGVTGGIAIGAAGLAIASRLAKPQANPQDEKKD